MIKILHSADWHMDAPLRQFAEPQRQVLRQQMLEIPGRIAEIVRREGCQIVLLAGDLFDGPCTKSGCESVASALRSMKVPVFVAPGNHDFYGEDSPWFRETWPENVHIFKKQEITSFRIPELDCRVYGAAFTGQSCPGLLEGFRADCDERHALMVLHGDPTSPDSPYCPVTAGQVREAGLDYLALGHIHAGGGFDAGAGLCAWPGCPMGHGFDETGTKGVLVVEVEEKAVARFVPVEGTRFYSLSVRVGEHPLDSVLQVLPGGGSDDFYRIRLTGEADPTQMEFVRSGIPGYPNLTLTDETVLRQELWEGAGEDTLEGLYCGILRNSAEGQSEQVQEELRLAAKLSRQILMGMEVELP